MSANQRNFAVGLTVLLATAVFGWMFLRFGTKSVSLFSPREAPIEIDAPRVDGLSEGSALTYQGVVVGRVTKLQRDPSGSGVHISALLATDPPVPVNVNAEIQTTNLIGGGAEVALTLQSDKSGAEEKPRLLPPGQPFPTIHAAYVGLQLNILPSEYGSTAQQITRAAKAIADASEEVRQRSLVAHVDEAVQSVTKDMNQAHQMLASIQDLISDPALKDNIRQTIANARKASEDLLAASAKLPGLANQASGTLTDARTAIAGVQNHVDDVSKQLGDGLTKASALLDSIHTVTDKINQGQGTVGLLVNDPKLYQGLVDSTRQLDLDLKDLQRLSEQWEQEGLSLKLK